MEKKESQISLFGENKENKKQERLDQTIDELKEKYGYHLITRAGKLELNDIIKFKE